MPATSLPKQKELYELRMVFLFKYILDSNILDKNRMHFHLK